jgi:hypothetical protein
MEVSGQLHAKLYLQGRNHGIHQTEGWVSPRASLNAMVKRKIPSPYQELNLGQPAYSLVIIRTELSWLLLMFIFLALHLGYCHMSVHGVTEEETYSFR